ncbi:ASCH domain-containing protein [Carnobacterium pleistocenium]|uniref:ASCH domain-containing protein n=1 Tax=Carnobacterium pleistocenium TaxID=181073 RepID=UPI0005521989|nr:ASCH domain-containing protein [Carnobacterium pleistocenium]
MKEQEMWQKFCLTFPEYQDKTYQAWSYGVEPDELARLTFEKVKTTTASAFEEYALENEALPKEGELNIILDANEEAVCVTKTIRVSVVSFLEVSEEHAYKEGEGDRSLHYWREVHNAFFKDSYTRKGLTFHDNIPVVCEEFEVIYK